MEKEGMTQEQIHITPAADFQGDPSTETTINSLVETSDAEKTVSVVMKAPVIDFNSEDQDIVGVLHKTAIISEVKNDEGIRQQIVDQAHKTINQNILKIDSDNTTRVQQAIYDVNKEACNCYGIEQSVPTWEVKLMRGGHAVWFVVYWLFASLTICPVNVFIKGIRSFIKNSWLAVVISVMCYALITIGIPLLIALLKAKGIDPTGGSDPEIPAEIVECVIPLAKAMML